VCDGLLASGRRRGVGGSGGSGRRQPRAVQARARAAQGVPFLPRPAYHLRVSKATPSPKPPTSFSAAAGGRDLGARRNARADFGALGVAANFS